MKKRRIAIVYSLFFLAMVLFACAKPMESKPDEHTEIEKYPLTQVSNTPLSERLPGVLYLPTESGVDGYAATDITAQLGDPMDKSLAQGLAPDGSIYAKGSNLGDNKLYRMNDAMDGWTELSGYAWMEEEAFADYYTFNFRVLDDGTFVGLSTGQNRKTDEVTGNDKFIYGNANGYEIKFSEPASDKNFCYGALLDTAGGRCVVIRAKDFPMILEAYDYTTGELLWQTDIWKDIEEDKMCVLGDELYWFAFQEKGRCLYVLDMNTGETLREQLMPQLTNDANKWQLICCPSNDGSGLIVAASTGLFYMQKDSLELTKLCEIKKLQAENSMVHYLYHLLDGSIFMTLLDADWQYSYLLYRYQDVVQEQDSDLTVFSLEDNALMRSAIAAYGKLYDQEVELLIGTDGDIPMDDAIRTLSAKILAGAGPDVLLMDGLPLDSYAEKGALADISDLLPPDDECYSGVVNAYKQPDGKVYAAPARFSVPTLLGKDVSGVKTLQDLAKWADTFEQKDFGIGSKGMMHTFFPLYAKDWIVNGQFQADVFRADLEAMGAISEQWRATTLKPVDKYQYNDASFMAYMWYAGAQCGSFGDIYYMERLMEPYSAIRELGGELKVYGDGMFTPATIVAMSATSRDPQSAAALIQTLFGEEVQSIPLSDGFSILRSVTESQKECPFGEDYEAESVIDWLSPLPETTLKTRWPKARDIDAFVSAFDTLTVPANVDYTLRDLFIKETLPYLLGEESIDSCMQRLTSKLSIYLAE